MRDDITTDSTDIKGIKEEYKIQFYANKSDNSDEMDIFSKGGKLKKKI